MEERDSRLTTQNSRIVVPGEHDDEEIDFYGILTEVIEIQLSNYRVILFRCKWFDIDRKRKRVRQDYHLTSINVTRTWYIEDPFILASQAQQVLCIDDPKLGKWWKVVEKV